MRAKAYGGARAKVLNIEGFFGFGRPLLGKISSFLPFFPGWCTFGRGLGSGFGLRVFYFVATLNGLDGTSLLSSSFFIFFV